MRAQFCIPYTLVCFSQESGAGGASTPPGIGRLHGKGYMVGVATGKGMGWDPSVHLKEHEKLVQKSIYSYKSIR